MRALIIKRVWLDLSIVKYKRPHAWILRDPVHFASPVPYKHPQGAQKWVTLSDDVSIAVDHESTTEA